MKAMFRSSNRLTCFVGGVWGTVLVMLALLILGLLSGFVESPFGTAALPPQPAQVSVPLETPAPIVVAARLAEAASPTPTHVVPTLVFTPTPTPLPLPTQPKQGFSIVETPHYPPTPSPTFIPTVVPFMEGPITIGKSVEQREIQVYRFGTGASKRLIIAGVHGGYEWNTVALADALIEHLTANPQIVPPHVTLYVLRVLNPDGYARSFGYEGRANANNVDINRNFPVDWAESWAPQGCWSHLPITSGPHPISEPETAALIGFVVQKRIQAMISYHSAALGIFAGGVPPAPQSASLAKALAEVSTYPHPPINTGCDATGQMADWASSLGIASVDVELHTHYATDFQENLRVLDAFFAWEYFQGSK